MLRAMVERPQDIVARGYETAADQFEVWQRQLCRRRDRYGGRGKRAASTVRSVANPREGGPRGEPAVPPVRAVEIRKVGVVGLGTMGAGIAQVCIQAGFETVAREVSEELCERGRSTIGRYLARGVEKGRLTQAECDEALGRLELTTGVEDLAGCELVIEAIVEELGPSRRCSQSSPRSRPTRSWRPIPPRSR